MGSFISEWQGGLLSWRPADKADWDEDDWAAHRRYSDDLYKDVEESGLGLLAFDEEIHERTEDGNWRSVETGQVRTLRGAEA